MDQDYFDELFAEANDEAVVDEKAPLSVEPAKEEEDVDPLERSRRARKIVNEIFEGDDDKDKDEDEEVDEEYTNDSLPNEQLPKNRPKLIPTGSQSDDKILEARRDFEEALARMKPSRRRREGDSEETGLDDLAIQFTNKMLAAVKADDEAVTVDKPALAKLKMLSEVEEMLLKKHMQEILLDNQVLDCIKKWLEPNIRGHLAVHSLRKRLLELLALLPIETTHLRESGLGRIVMFYYVRERESLDVRKLAGDLIATWSRPIIGTTLDYNEMMKSHDREGKEATESSSTTAAAGKIKQLQSDKFKKLARSGALDRGNGRNGGRYQRLTQTLNRQKKK